LIVSRFTGRDVQFTSCGTNVREATVVPQQRCRLPKQRYLKGVARYIDYFIVANASRRSTWKAAEDVS
jgi:hypothetical protein